MVGILQEMWKDSQILMQISNVLGNIYNGYSNAVEGYMERKSVLQKTGSRAFELYNSGQFNSWTSALILNNIAVQNLLNLNSSPTYLEMVGYIYSED